MSTKTKRLNVLIYAGKGATANSVKHATFTLRRALGSNYAVITVTGEQILKEPWQSSCALLVFPGGGDLGYCSTLNGEGNRRIKQYLRLGGSYLGLCAGGYYGSARCEFEVGKRAMEVVGDRELGLFPGTCRGLAFPGFVYQSEKGARAVALKVNKENLMAEAGSLPAGFRSYYNGGGVFVDADQATNVEILAEFAEDVAVESGKSKAAIVFSKIGEGRAILSGPHPEFSGHNLNPAEPSGDADYPALVEALLADDKPRIDFIKACLTKLGLHVSHEEGSVPSLSNLHLSAANSAEVSAMLDAWREAGILSTEPNGDKLIQGENDTFCLVEKGTWTMGAVARAVTDALPDAVKNMLSTPSAPVAAQSHRPSVERGSISVDPDALVKSLEVHEHTLPEVKETPYFNHAAFYANLKDFRSRRSDPAHGNFGQVLLYGEVVTSTSTLLEKNSTWLAHLPAGFTATATTQVAGRGRGSNVWVSPPGCLMFSTVLRHPLSLSNTAPVTFVQYLAALAIVDAIKDYSQDYHKLPVKLKWPNDVYARDPGQPANENAYVKIGGILVNSSYAGGDYTLVVGIGLNVNNSTPSVSLSQLAQAAGLPAFTSEQLLAAILVHFEAMYSRFCVTGFDEKFESNYYENWLHTGQVVTLEMEGGARGRIRGITRDWGLLVAEELDRLDRPTGRRWELQSDSNSFDFLKGLLRKKM